MSDEVCGHEKDDGSTCEVDFGLCDCHGLCFPHSPCREEDRQQARSRGGHSTARKRGKKTGGVLPVDVPPAPTSVGEAARTLGWLSEAVLRGDVDRHTARDVGYLLRAFVDASETDVEERLEKVEERLEGMEEPWTA